MGCANIWLVDHEEKYVEVWTGESWQPFHGERLEAVGTPAFLDLRWLWSEFA